MRTHYDNLHVSEKAGPEVIKGAYKALAQKWHPDKHPDQREKAERYFKIITRAFEVLSDPKSRAEYDAWLADRRNTAEPLPEVEPPPKKHEQGNTTEEIRQPRQKLKESKFKSIAFSLAGAAAILILAAFGKVIGKGLTGSFNQSTEAKIISGLKEGAAKENARLPMNIDDDTRWDRVSIGPGIRANYLYTLLKYRGEEIDGGLFSESIRDELSLFACTDKNTRYVMQHGGIFSYTYRGNNAAEIATISISVADCATTQAKREPTPKPTSPDTPNIGHFEKIKAIHPDASTIASNPAFISWKAVHPERARIADSGTADEVIALLNAYKAQQTNQRQPPAPTAARPRNPYPDCVIRQTMTDADYAACGIKPPGR